MRIGDIYWLNSKDEINHPQVIIKIEGDTLFVVALTTNMNKANMPGNVILEIGEANLEKQSIIEVYKSKRINTSELKTYIGTLSHKRIEEINKGIGFINRSFLK